MSTPSLITNGLKLYMCFVRLCNQLQAPLLLIIRLFWGGSFVMTGLGKWQNIQAVTQFFTEIQVPFPMINAYVVAIVELVCGALLVIGLFSRAASLPLIATLIVAYISSEQEALHSFFSNPNLFLMATPFLFLMATVTILAFGPGLFSIDHLFKKKAQQNSETTSKSRTA